MKRSIMVLIVAGMLIAGGASGASKSPKGSTTPSDGGKLSATISVAYQYSSGVRFNVARSGGKANDAYKLWVANKCYSGDQLVSADYNPVLWPEGGELPVNGYAEFTSRGNYCTAYVWVHPYSQSPLQPGISYAPAY